MSNKIAELVLNLLLHCVKAFDRLLVTGHKVYYWVSKIPLVSCFLHARRKLLLCLFLEVVNVVAAVSNSGATGAQTYTDFSQGLRY